MENAILNKLNELRYLNYKMYCPFTLDNIDYKLHFKRRCALYNIDKENYYPFQYICSYNVEENQILSKFFSEKGNIKSYSDFKCSKIISLINNNKVINDFLEEYYKDDNYYCDFKNQINNLYKSINPKACAKKIYYPELFMILYIIFSASFIILSFTYFRNIKANLNIEYYNQL